MITDALIEVPRGDYQEIDFKIVDEDENPVDITSYQKRFSVKVQKSDPDSEVVLTKISPNEDIVDLDTGLVRVILKPEETRLPVGTYYFDLKLYNGQEVRTPVMGKFRVKEVVWKDEA